MENFINIENVKKLLLDKGIHWRGTILVDGSKERVAKAEDFVKDYNFPFVNMLYLDDGKIYEMRLRVTNVILELYQDVYNRGTEEDETRLIEDFSADWQELNLNQYKRAYAPYLKDMVENQKKIIIEEIDDKISELMEQIEVLEQSKLEQLKPLQEIEDKLCVIESEPGEE